MACCTYFIAIICIIVGYGYRKFVKLTENLPRPNFSLTEYWGKGKVADYKEDTTIKPFKVEYSKEVNKFKIKSTKGVGKMALI